jgi:hypothetical protein
LSVALLTRHPELVDDAPPPPAPTASPPKLKFERAPRWSERNVRRALGKDRAHTAKLRDKIAFQATMRRIERGGV